MNYLFVTSHEGPTSRGREHSELLLFGLGDYLHEVIENEVRGPKGFVSS